MTRRALYTVMKRFEEDTTVRALCDKRAGMVQAGGTVVALSPWSGQRDEALGSSSGERPHPTPEPAR